MADTPSVAGSIMSWMAESNFSRLVMAIPVKYKKGHGQNLQRKTEMTMSTPNPVKELARIKSSGNSIMRRIRRERLELRTS